MSSSNLIDLMTLTWNLPLNFDVAFCNWLDKFLPPTDACWDFHRLFQLTRAYIYDLPYGLDLSPLLI